MRLIWAHHEGPGLCQTQWRVVSCLSIIFERRLAVGHGVPESQLVLPRPLNLAQLQTQPFREAGRGPLTCNFLRIFGLLLHLFNINSTLSIRPGIFLGGLALLT